MYKIDNRPKRHRGRYTALGIILGIGLTIIGMYFMDNYSQLIFQYKKQISDSVVSYLPSPSQDKVSQDSQKALDQISKNSDQGVQNQQPQKQDQSSNNHRPIVNPQVTSIAKPEIDPLNLASIIHELINKQRQNNNLQILSYDDRLASIATSHSQDMVDNNYFDHTGSDGSGLRDRYTKAQYPCAFLGENIEQNNLYDYESVSGNQISYHWISAEQIAQSTVSDWMNSPDHRDNVLRSTFNTEGIGVAINTQNQVLITEDFC